MTGNAGLPNMTSATIFVQQAGAVGLASGIETGMLTLHGADLALGVVHAAIGQSGFQPGVSHMTRLHQVLGGYAHMDAPVRQAAHPQICALLRDNADAVDVAVMALGVAAFPGADDAAVAATTLAPGTTHEFVAARIDANYPIAVADRTFAMDLLRKIGGQKFPAHTVSFSPFSATAALSLAMSGAGGDTLRAIRRGMNLGDLPVEALTMARGAVTREIFDADKGVVLRSANSLWLHRAITPSQAFLDATARLDGARAVDKLNAGAVPVINRWVYERTDGMIPEIVSEGSLDPQTAMLLVNALYFHGPWTMGFDLAKTTMETFFPNRDMPGIKVSMMRNTARYRYLDNGPVRMLELPYGNGSFSMIICVPSDPSANGWMDEVASLMLARPVMGYIEVPRFVAESSMDLGQALYGLGMGIAFDRDQANFSGMYESSPESLYISHVLQRAKVEVDERGTCPAAAMIARMAFRGAPSRPSEEFRFIVNEPFFYVLQHNATRIPMFMGWMQNPQHSVQNQAARRMW